MRKIFILFYLFISCISLAQKTGIEKDSIGITYHFDLLIEINTSGEFAEFSKLKLINTSNDDIEGVSANLNFIDVHDFNRGFVHAFRRINNDENSYFYIGSHKKISTRNRYHVKIQKLSLNKYQLTRYNPETNRSSQILIINIEDFEYDAANSLHIHDVLFLNSRYLKTLRRKERGRNFIIKKYQTTYDGKKINNSSVINTEKIDITLIVPKKLKFYPKIKIP